MLAYYDIFKSLHIIFVVSWFAGLFYIVRLFIYHTEANQKPDAERKVLQEQFDVMQKRLWYIITTPAMILTVVFGALMLFTPERTDYLLGQPWMQLKLAFVGVLLVYHFICQMIMNRLKHDRSGWTSMHLRLWNEVATLLLVAIVFLVISKDAAVGMKGVLGFFGVAIALMIGIRIYKKLRKG